MNPVRQIVQILQKDLRAHPLEIGLLLLLNLFLVLIATEPWFESSVLGSEYPGNAIELALQLAFIVIWCLLIAQVIQADTPAGKASYWLTRPLSRLAVPAAKTAFVLLVVHLPIFAAQMIIVIGSGVPLSVPQLLVNQAVFLVYLSLPVMLVASLTKSLSQFVIAIVFVAALVVIMQGVIFGSSNLPDVVDDLLDPIPLEVAAWMFAVGVVSGGALFWQYRKRLALLVASCCAGVLLLLYLVTAAIPGSVEHWSRTLLLGASSNVPEIRFRPSAERPVIVESVPDGWFRLSLPLEVSKSENVEFLSAVVRVRMLTGPGRTFEGRGVMPPPSTDGYRVNVLVPDDFLENELSVRIVIDSVQFEIRDGDAIPLNGRPAIVDGRAQCGLAQFRDRASGYVLCRSSFRPLQWYRPGAQRVAIATDYFAPFRFSMNPIVEDQVVQMQRPTDDSATFATNLQLAAGFLRQVVEIDRVRPEDWIAQ